MQIRPIFLVFALAFVAALSININAQTVDPTQPGLRIRGQEKTETGDDYSEGVCAIKFFAMDGLSLDLKANIDCWRNEATYQAWAAGEPNSLPGRRFMFAVSGEQYKALLRVPENAELFARFLDKLEKVLLQDAKLSEKLRNNRTP